MKLKLIILLISILNIQFAFSQSVLEEEEFVEYSEEFAIQDFETAVKLENSDSLKNAIRFYRYVAKFDSTNEIGKFSIAKLDSIWTIEKEDFQNQLIGEWRWIWSGTNWGTEDSPKKCNCQKYLKFESNEILVFEDNQIKERLTYEVEKDIDRIGTSYFLIDINNGEMKWRFRIYQEVENSYYLMERSKNAKFFLSFRDEGLIPNCVCGCPEKRFEKNKHGTEQCIQRQ